MNENNNNLRFDEDDAVAFIRKYIPKTVSDQYSDDEILFIVDTIWDYYESKGLVRLNKELSENEDEDLKALVAYVKKEVARDGEILMDPADVKNIVEGELAYEESIEISDN